ncbi:FAD-dependent oxidoreductase [Alteribacter natronophilus]|uniref:FAD-dependent oxidoreductase n=1 Tax=Alteribacter natronophilus TaxID=2583810 RepID=UPI00110E3B43|nr:FAD-dependent oxidoreductase [Alteribacter natronophilus]TMW72279.1 FAD-dependent oxidoreductase [Alteribacter natronophilus]
MTAVTRLKSDVMIIGGGVGGAAAALSAARSGKKVVMTEEEKWIGGQLTSQAVPPDEHPWIEQFGCTATYRDFRNRVREYYKQHYPLTPEARRKQNLNPGNGWVSRLCHEPKVALAVLHDMLAPYESSGKVEILHKHRITGAETEGDLIKTVTVRNLETGSDVILEAPYFLDATECGDVLPAAGVEYVTGAESIEQTGEPSALEEADPLDMQAVSVCFALDYKEGEDHTIEKPEDYEFWKEYEPDFWPDKLLSWTHPFPENLKPWSRDLFKQEGRTLIDSLWLFRRIIDKDNFEEGFYESDITLVNWPQIDYWLGPVFEIPEEERQKHLKQAKQLSLSFLYWMQTEAPRPDGGYGYPGLRLRKDIVGTEDGMAVPYIRESRRIEAEFTVVEQHVSPDHQPEVKGEYFYDSVGVGSYRIDLHPSTGDRNYLDVSSLPFQIPLGSLIPKRVKNLVAAAKNIGVTHITTGCYRLHPVEWNIGEAAGALAAYCIEKGLTPSEVRNSETELKAFQETLEKAGVELDWPELQVR